MCKINIKIDVYYANIYKHEHERKTWQSYGARSWLKLLLNILKEMKGHTFIYAPLGT
jgi:hypothetical protein